MQRMIVPRTDLSSPSLQRSDAAELAPGEVRLRIDRFGFSANNITYALFGDALGYWRYFPVDEVHGSIPVWGFAEVVESRSDRLSDGERLFGYLPLADEHVFRPTEVSDLAASDGSAHRASLHPWYNRFYRCAGDPLWTADDEHLQATMWALFMTGWALADQLVDTARIVVVSSASSKTALALAWTLHHRAPELLVVGITSPGNVEIVDTWGLYDDVTTYESLHLPPSDGPFAFVDAAGSPATKERVHAELGDRLTDSIALGATHQRPGQAAGELAGPTPRLFFIPDVAERAATEVGLGAYHGAFTEQWQRFVPWIAERLAIDTAQGADGILHTYRTVLAGGLGPEMAKVLTW
ncbi:MAG: DUF2855 family protein [Actinomycetota bacterium]